jgi:signal transduction histidine kinase
VLRSDDGEREGELGPQPGLDDLDDLLAEVRATGVAVDLEVRGEPRPLGEGVSLSAYRILQEAVTNAMKHAPRQPIRITVDHGPGAVVLEVANDGSNPNAAATGGTARVGGHGIIGMRERALLHDGSFHAGPATDGRGWVVRAELPLDAVPA